MKKRISRGHLIRAGAVLALAFAAPPSSARVGPPPGDLYRLWIDQRISQHPDYDLLFADENLAATFVEDTSTPYTSLRPQTLSFRGQAWTEVFRALTEQGASMSREEATVALAWDFGFTNGYPGVVDPDHPDPDLGARWSGAHLAKAGVHRDIARKALALAGPGSYVIAANLAVALQVLSDKLSCYDSERWESIGLRSDVMGRFMLAETLDQVTDFDLAYVSRLLQVEMSQWHAGRMGIYGRRQLPAPFRVARVAAAFRETHGYGAQPCDDDGRPRELVAAQSPLNPDKDLCLVAANDRAVYAWYLRMLKAQTDPPENTFIHATAARLTRAIAPGRPMWLGVFSRDALRGAASVELVESLLADGLAQDGTRVIQADRYAARRLQLLCQKETAP